MLKEYRQNSLFNDGPVWYYEPNADNSERYLLGIKGKRPLMCFGVNPSTAEPDNLDNTLKSVQRFAFALGYDAWMMLNLYPQRATNPNDMHEKLNEAAHKQNLSVIRDLFALYPGADIWAAWGALIEKRAYLSKCLSDIYRVVQAFSPAWYTIGKRSKAGHPHHPLYLASGSAMEPFDIESYLRNSV